MFLCQDDTARQITYGVRKNYRQRPGFMQVGISIPSAQPTVNPFFI